MFRCTASIRYQVQNEIADWDSVPSRRINGGSRAEATRSIPRVRVIVETDHWRSRYHRAPIAIIRSAIVLA